MMKRIRVLIINGCLLGVMCCLNLNVVAEEANVDQLAAGINRQLDHLQLRLFDTTTLDELAILQKDLVEVKEKIELLPDSKETEEIKKKFNSLSTSVREDRMDIKARVIEPDIWPGRSWLLLVITDEKDLDALLEKVQKVRQLYKGYMEKADDTDYYQDFEYAYEEFENNVKEEFITKIVLRESQTDLQTKVKLSKEYRKILEKDIEKLNNRLREIQEELKKSKAELKEICSKIDKLSE